MARGMLLVGFDFKNAHADEFHDWYDLEHIPEREAVPGFGLCERWISVSNPTVAVASYDLDSIDVLRSDAYKAIGGENLTVWSKRVTAMCDRLMRYEGIQTLPGDMKFPEGAGGLLVNAMNVDAEVEDDFNKWYDGEHIPDLSKVSGCISARRYVAASPEPGGRKYVAVYSLEAPEVVKTEAWAKAANSAWTDKLRPHFRDHLRIVTKRYVRGEA